jgi:hypothetical protein
MMVMILKWLFEKKDAFVRSDVAKGAGGMVGYCEHGNEPSGFIKCG